MSTSDVASAETAASPAILKALQERREESAGCRCLTEMLAVYQRALCSDCISCEQVAATMLEWRAWLDGHRDAMSVLESALHASATDWLLSSWSVDWLFGDELEGVHCEIRPVPTEQGVPGGAGLPG